MPAGSAIELTIIVPTFNEGPNVVELVRRIGEALGERSFEVLFVDDSVDDTPAIITRTASTTSFPVRLLHRDDGAGGLGGAVVEGLRAARARRCLVMDGDLQHPPELIAQLLLRMDAGDADVVVASRYMAGGAAKGLANSTRTAVSRLSTVVTKSMFPTRLHGCSDPMTGFFVVDRDAIDLDALRPRGFKILLEILARGRYRVAEIPFAFAPRFAGESKASLRQGIRFLLQLLMLRFGRMSVFALVGGIGALANLAVMWLLTLLGVEYLLAAVIASEVTIVGNFLMIEFLVFADLREESGSAWIRFAKSFAFNNAEAAVRIPVVWVLVTAAHFPSVIAAAIALALAFVARFVFHARVVYAPRRAAPALLEVDASELPSESPTQLRESA